MFFVATLTPFDSRGRVDLPRLRAHILWLAAQGVDGFIPTASVGEFLYLSDRERQAVHRTVLDVARGRAVYPCTWDPSPSTTKYLTDAALEQGASGVLMPPPLYYDVGEQALDHWFRSFKDETDLPVIAYHTPRYIRSNLSLELYARLRADGVLAGLHDCSGDFHRVRRLSNSDPGAVFVGNDRTMSQSASLATTGGFVSEIANVWPNFCRRIYKAREHQLEDALNDRIGDLGRAGGLRAMKAMLNMGCRLPMPAPQRADWEGLPAAEMSF